MPSDNLNGVGGGIGLAEVLVVRDPTRVLNHGICRVQVVEQIQRTGSSVAQVLPL